ncbi:MAG TPA: hypothetical protein VHV28_05540, partial [Solirubrobacteraceae bacterium]|nr:hypothetical protein [Solirubrobacteraceae bacterium]
MSGPDRDATAVEPATAEPAARASSTAPRSPTLVESVLQLQRSVGNRGVGSMLARTPLKTAPGQDGAGGAGGAGQDIVTSARSFAAGESGNLQGAAPVDRLSTIIAIGHQSTYAMDTSGDSLRQLSFTPKQIEKGTQRGFIIVGRGWTAPMNVLVGYDE